jgi:superfamily II DNA or RNA helicase
MKLVNKKEIDKPIETYNLHVERDHNYIANDAVVSNCHMASADVLKKLLTQKIAKAPIRWGLSGTIPKEDFKFQSIKVSLGDVVNYVSAHELQEKGILSNCHVNIIQTVDSKEFKFYADELKYLVTNEKRVSFISNLVKEISNSGNTLVLVDRIETGKMMQENLNKILNVSDIPFISGSVKSKDRKEEYDEIRTADNKIIIATYGVASVGINIPRLFNLALIEPGKSFVRVIQSIGRGLRKADDKDSVNIYDITSTTKYAKRHLSTRKKYYNEAKYQFSQSKVNY